ncbi:oxidoreductase FAD/NAD(P)-binding domain-containing protein [Marinobacter lipolyticus SM19]|uniref:Oxidoreductase FAD/NAD(P)-binding domain-containing protein n=1 Tax=Marinobacter lipolyticus SM19 TaxID=1318628 RepID=R8B4V7_9GAMM|nr:FAD/NAD(P)-binding protein [Marinobacter lipolyticus]EON93622.1 oxidoreductase FAD/NAD(P)-binding domain-containing protein [Marinobacter lipolyticus SM19]
MISDDFMVPEPVRVLRKQQELETTWTLELEPGGAGRRPFLPGQFNMLYMFGVGEVPISLSGDAGQTETLIHTVRAVGPVSNKLAALKPMDAVGLRGPFGVGWPMTAGEGADLLIVAGGLGLAPLRPAIYHVLRHRERYGRVILLYGTRSPEDILYAGQLEEWNKRPDVEVHITVDHAGGDWLGKIGVVPSLVPSLDFDPEDTVAMVCGPEVMMRFTVNALRDAGVEDESIYLSMERNMKCALGHCGHCQFGSTFVCKDGPVLSFDRLRGLLSLKEF